MNELQPVTLGEGTADLVIRDGRVLLPESGAIRERDVAVVGDRIAALPESADAVVGEDTAVVDAAGCTTVPGFVDAHTHVDATVAAGRAYHRWLLGGTTTVVTEASALGRVFGADGVRALLEATADLPVAVRATVPPQPLVDTFEPADADAEEARALAALLDEPRVVGVGEVDWIHVVGRDPPLARLVERAREAGKPVTGHGAGASGENLAAFATVVDDDHEAIDADGLVERVEAGLHAIGRSGSIRDDADALAAAYERLGAAELSVCSDGVRLATLLAGNYMDGVLRRVIDAGVPPADAVRMVTLNPARHFGLDGRGSLAPGSVADLAVLSDLEAVAVRDVLVGGEVVVRDGDPLVGPREHDYPDRLYDSVAVEAPPERFRVPAGSAREGRVRAVECGEGLLSGEAVVRPRVVDGTLAAAPGRDVLLAALLDRRPGVERGFTGFLAGFGLDAGAVATTQTWEVPGLLAVGADPDAMAAAVRRVADRGGGWVVHDGEDVIAELALPIGGVAADLPIEAVEARFGDLARALRELGCTQRRSLVTLQTLTFPGVPALKFSFSGYADVLAREVVGVDPGAGVSSA